MEFPNLSNSRRKFLDRATSDYVDQLAGSAGLEYLHKRGLTDDLIAFFRLGFVAEPVEGHESFRGWISIPYLTPAGLVAVRFRRLGDGEPKYLQEDGTGNNLYNVGDLHRPEPYIALIEGEFDTEVMSYLCDVPAVGLPGLGTWDKNGDVWRRLFEDYEKVFVVMDPDKQGQKMAKKIMSAVPDPVKIILPADVNDTYLTFGPEFIRAKMGLE